MQRPASIRPIWISTNPLGLSSFLILLSLCSIQAACASDKNPPRDAAKVEFFEKKIRPMLVENCYNCHSADSGGRGGLRVDDRNGLIEGGGRGAGIIVGKPEQSLLIRAVRHQGLEMPPKKQLTDEQIADLETWIRDGAAWPAVEVPDDLIKPKPEYEQLRREHWAWQPLSETAPPKLADESFVFNDIDRFILSKLNETQLKPVRDADRQALIRRVTFDLTGLPPKPEEVAQFESDAAADAFEKVVDRLLKSPAFGERWARHWLDVARYGESTGSARNLPMPHAWRYRDYVINAFTNDKPYDQFIREQVAGDLLPANSPGEKIEQLVATGFLALGVKDVNQRFKVRYVMDNIDEQIDTLSRSVLALTASCARCHDHKFDPIPTVDYYALAGIFHSSELCAGLRNKMGGGGFDYYDTAQLIQIGLKSTIGPEGVQKIEDQKKLVATIRDELQAIRGKPEGQAKEANGQTKEQKTRESLQKAERELFILTDPAMHCDFAYGLRDSQKIGDTEVRIRGEAEQLGPQVPRGFLSVLTIPDQPQINNRQSGRLELAYWLTSEKNPLTQRVIVNRIWRSLFNQGIVSSVDNFGVTGDRPTHPELLDYLARNFVQNGWSIKKLVRLIVLSHAYRLSSDSSDAADTVDPANRLVWRHSPRRLEAEEIRDAMLASSGLLKRGPAEVWPSKNFKVVEIPNNGPQARLLREASSNSLHRSMYLPLVRGILPRSLEVFDFADQGLVTGNRDATTVPTQALYLLNDPFVRRQALALAQRLPHHGETDDIERIRIAYRLTFSRSPTSSEIERALQHLVETELMLRELNLASTENQELAANQSVVAVGDSSTVQNATGSNDSIPPAPTSAPPAVKKPKVQADADDSVDLKDPKTAAWTSFCQALFGSAEFRYLQ